MVRGWQGQKATGVPLICGSRVVREKGRTLLLYPLFVDQANRTAASV